MQTDESACGCGRCLTCSYETVGSAPATVNRRRTAKRDETTAAAAAAVEYDDNDPPSEAAAFMASVSAATVILIAAFLALVLSSAALWTFTVVVPMAHAAASNGTPAAGYLRDWQQQRQLQDYRPLQKPHLWQLEQKQHQQQQHQQLQHQQQILLQRYGDDRHAPDTTRPKRQLFNRNANREPGIVSLTFSLIGGVSTHTLNQTPEIASS